MKGWPAISPPVWNTRLLGRGLGKARARARGAPWPDVLGLMVPRETDRREKPPASLAAAVDLWRPVIEAKAGADLDKLIGALRDQKAFARHLSRRTMC